MADYPTNSGNSPEVFHDDEKVASPTTKHEHGATDVSHDEKVLDAGAHAHATAGGHVAVALNTVENPLKVSTPIMKTLMSAAS